MFRFGVFYCRHCGLRCPVKGATDRQQRDGRDAVEEAFFQLVEDPKVGVADLDEIA